MLKWIGVLFVLVSALVTWEALTGVYSLNPGESAVILRLGAFARTEAGEGLHFHLPRPIESAEVVKVGTIQRVEFGNVDDPERRAETAMQTNDNNIVHLEFVVRYRIAKPFESLYRVGNLEATLRDASQAAMREVIGRNTIDGALSDERANIEAQAAERLQQILEKYETGLNVQSVELQEVQPPGPVRESFDDVISANQDRNRRINEAEGYANEVLPQSRAEARELLEAATGYRDATIAEAEGEGARFMAVVAEYQKAPEITRKRLYLETMEEILPGVEKVIIEQGSTPVLPYLPLRGVGEAR